MYRTVVWVPFDRVSKIRVNPYSKRSVLVLIEQSLLPMYLVKWVRYPAIEISTSCLKLLTNEVSVF